MPTVTMHVWHLAILATLVVALAAVAVRSHRQAKSWAARAARQRQNYTITRTQLNHVAALVDDMVPHLPRAGAGPKLRRLARDLLP